jgi:xylan 1,4-beta-xylosidase
MYSSYTAASFARIWELARLHGVNLDAALSWAFTFEDQPLFAGFRQLASGGIDLPVLNVFRMFSQMTGEQLAVTSDAEISLEAMKKNGVRGEPDVAALAVLDKNKLSVLVWHYHDDDVAGPDAAVKIALQGLPIRTGNPSLIRYAIDADHSNAFSAWQKMGSPVRPTAEQYAELEKAGRLSQMGPVETLRSQNGTLDLSLSVPRQGVCLLNFTWDQ